MKRGKRPRLAVLLLRLLFRGEAQESILGDIEEEFRAEIEPNYGVEACRQWYWRQVRGSITSVFMRPEISKEDARGKVGRIMESLLQDIRFGCRLLLRQPAFTITAVLTLALGIGANTTIFSVVNAVLLRPLPFPEADRLMAVKSVNPTAPDRAGVSSPADFYDWQAQTRLFEHLAIETPGGGTLTGIARPEGLAGARVSEDFFATLRINPFMGRAFMAAEFSRNSAPAVVLSYGIWQRLFSADPDIIGKTIELDRASTTVVGVMPAKFKEPSYADIWTPLLHDSDEAKTRSSRYMTVIGRLKPGVTVEQAQAEMTAIAGGLEEQYPQWNRGWAVQVVPLKEERTRQVRLALYVLLAAVIFVLLIACANVTSLLLARATARYKELAVRAALGASQRRIVQQLLTESLLLALTGGGLGLLLASWGVRAIPSVLPQRIGLNQGYLPRADEISVDARVLAFTFAVAVATGVVFGLVPALSGSRQNLFEMLKQDGRGSGAGRGRTRFRSLLVIAEVAMALVLLVGGGLLLRSFQRLLTADLGFDSQRLLTISITVSRKYPSPPQWADYYKRILDRLSTLPGVRDATLITSAPLAGFNMGFPFRIEGQASDPNEQPFGNYSYIAANYFRALGIPLLRGREFSDFDNSTSPGVAIINETLARRYFRDQDPISKRIKIDLAGQPLLVEIVGVAGDTKQMSIADNTREEIYVPYQQHPWFLSMVMVRTETDPAAMAGAIQQAIWSVDPDQSLGYMKTMEQMAAESVAQPRFYALLLGLFAGIALTLAAIGIYGVMSYSVAQRTQEIGIRMALGAMDGDVLAMVIRQGMALALTGVAIGLITSLAMTRAMGGLLYGISPTDAVTYVGISAVLVVTALAACWFPARRATKIDQMVALRYE